MRKGRIFFLLAFILILCLAGAGVVYFKFLQPAAAQPPPEVAAVPQVEMVPVVVVSQHVPRGGKLDETVLTMLDIPRDALIASYFTDMGEVVGRQARVDLEASMMLTRSMVVDTADQLSGTGSLAALSIPRGMVAISIPISRLSGVSYAPQSGDHVNIIATLLMVDLDAEFQSITPNHSAAVVAAGLGVVTGSSAEDASQAGQGGDQAISTSSAVLEKEIQKLTAQNLSGGPASVMGRPEIDPLLDQTYYVVPSEPQRPRLVSQTLLQDAIVLGVGDFAAANDDQEGASDSQPASEAQSAEDSQEQPAPKPDQSEADQEDEAPPPLPDVITIIVTPQDAVTLNYLVYSGAQLTLALRSAGDDSKVPTEAATLDFLLKQYSIPVPVKLPYGLEPRLDQILPVQLPNDQAAEPE